MEKKNESEFMTMMNGVASQVKEAVVNSKESGGAVILATDGDECTIFVVGTEGKLLKALTHFMLNPETGALVNKALQRAVLKKIIEQN